MKTFKRILYSILTILAILFAIAFIYVRHIATKGLPDYTGKIKLAGMISEVTVIRDEYAIPHIYAKNDDDLYRAVGYVMAQDRLWQMDLLRRATMGRLSEIFGADMVDTDLLMRMLRISKKSKQILDSTDVNIKNALIAFADGVNQYIDTHKDKLPPEFSILGYKPEKWEPIHSINLVGYMSWDLTSSWNSEIFLNKIREKLGEAKLKDLVPELKRQTTPIYPNYKMDSARQILKACLINPSEKLEELGLVVFNASNNWAVSGKKSTSGKPILANDMHLGLFAPGIWYQIHEVIEGKLNVTGLALPGQPMVIAGHNERVAWGMTNVMLDDADFYQETVNPNDSNQYKFDGNWRKMEIDKETIKIKGGISVEKTLRFTHRGPVVSGFHKINNNAISMRWIGNEFSNEIRSVYLLNRQTNNWSDFCNAVKTFISVSQNIVYADVDGNIGLYCSAGVPIRKGDGFTIQSGETDEYDWKGLVPFEKLPHEYNPERGYVSSANNKTAPDDYPYYISLWFDPPYRIDRIREMLESKDKLSIDDFVAMQADAKSKLAERFNNKIVVELKKIDNPKPMQFLAIQELENWDCTMDKDKVAPAIFDKLYYQIVKNLVSDEMGDDLFNDFIKDKILVRNMMENVFANPNSEWCDDINTKDKKENLKDIIQKSFNETITDLENQFGHNPQKWQWGKLHTLTLKHPMGKVKILDLLFSMNSATYPVNGSYHTVGAYGYNYKTDIFKVNHGSSHRHIFSIANWDESLTILPTGTSGIPASAFYCDQTKLYVNNKYHEDLFSKANVQKHAKFTMIIN